MSDTTNALRDRTNECLAEVRHYGMLLSIVKGDTSPRDLTAGAVDELVEFLTTKAGMAARAATLMDARTSSNRLELFQVVSVTSFDRTTGEEVPPAA